MNDNVSLDYYKIFYHVAKEQNLTRAAEKLFISQPAVTQTINKLEQLTGEKLFYRQSKGMALTEIGQRLFKQVESALFYIDKIPNVINNAKQIVEGQIKIGGGTNILRDILPNAISGFLKVFPAITFQMIDEHKSILLEDLANGKIDIAIVQSQNIDSSKFDFDVIAEDKFMFFCHKDYKISPFVTLEELAGHEFIMPINTTTTRKVADEVFEKNNFLPKIKFEVAGQNLIYQLAEKKLGIGILPYERIKKEVQSGLFKIVETEIKLPVFEYCCVTLKDYSSSATKAFLPFLFDYKIHNE